MKMKSIRLKVLVGFLLITLIMVAVAGITYYQLHHMEDELRNLVEVEYEFYRINQDLAFNIAERSNNARGYLLTGNQIYLENFHRLSEESDALHERLLELSDSEEDGLFVSLSLSWRNLVLGTIVPIYERGDIENAINLANVTMAPEGDAIIAVAQSMAQARQANIISLGDEMIELQQSIAFIVTIASFIALVLSIAASLFISNAIVNPINKLLNAVNKVAQGDLRETVRISSKDELGQLAQAFNAMVNNLKNLINETNISAEQVAASSQQLMASAEETAASSEQIAASIQQIASGAEQQESSVLLASDNVKEMISGLQQVAANAQVVRESSEIATKVSATGAQSVDRAVVQMGTINSSVSESAKIISQLGVRSEQIGKIVEVISGIAEQTNLLALNAAIEAARAGEQGRGFAVVAEEVRKLAEQSAGASHEISALIGEIQAETNKAVESMKKGTREVEAGTKVVSEAGHSFKEVLENVQNVNNQLEEMSAIVEQLAKGSDQVAQQTEVILSIARESSSSSQEVASITEEQTSAMEEVSKSTQQLTLLADSLHASIKKFTV